MAEETTNFYDSWNLSDEDKGFIQSSNYSDAGAIIKALRDTKAYVGADKNKKDDQPIGMLPVDSIFTPVTRVNFLVENTRVGQITDYDKLSLEVWTNGTIAPDDAVSYGARILNEHLNLFIDLSDNAKDASIMVEKEEGKKDHFQKLHPEDKPAPMGG